MIQLGPVQFNFRKLWFHSRRNLIHQDSIQAEFARIQARWLEVAEFKYEENSTHDEELAREELELDIHVGRVKTKDLDWLRDMFENIHLADLSLMIAQYVMPEKTWEIIERGEEAAVTDVERSVVFDMKHGEEVSAGASLMIAGDAKYQPTREVLEEVTLWFEQRAVISKKRLDRVIDDLARFSDSGLLLHLPLSSEE